jgi:hypothetical protein
MKIPNKILLPIAIIEAIIIVVLLLMVTLVPKVVELPTNIATFEPTLVVTPTITTTPVLINTPEPLVMINAIPTPFYFPCRETAVGSCIRKDTPAIEAIARTIYGEGGAVNLQLAVDMIQVLDNAMFNEWNCDTCTINVRLDNRLYTETTIDERERLAMYVLSRPYTVGKNTYPAWNCWEKTFPWKAISETPYSQKLWDKVYGTVERWIMSPEKGISATWNETEFVPTLLLRVDSSIVYFYGGLGYNASLAQSASYVYPFKVGTAQYYIYYSTLGHAP